MRSPTSNVGNMDKEGMNRGSATNERNASDIASAAKTVFASSVVTFSHSGNGPLLSPAPPPPPPSSSPPPSSLFPPLFSNSRTGFDSSAAGPSIPLHWILPDRVLGLRSLNPRKLGFFRKVVSWVGLKLVFLVKGVHWVGLELVFFRE